MSEYTPTTDEVRGDYAHFQTPGGTDPVTGEFAEGLAEFDRWLAKHDAEVECAAAEKAWDEGEQAGYEDALGEQRGIRPNESARNPHRREEA